MKFYPDKDGISDKTKFLYVLKNGLCKDPTRRQVKRIFVKNKTEILPLCREIKLFAAIHNEEHIFYESPNSEAGIAKFSNLWELEDYDWKLVPSLSFDHKEYENKSK